MGSLTWELEKLRGPTEEEGHRGGGTAVDEWTEGSGVDPRVPVSPVTKRRNPCRRADRELEADVGTGREDWSTP